MNLLLLSLLAFGAQSFSQSGVSEDTLPQLRGVDIEEQLGKRIPNVQLVDEAGDTVPLYSFFDGKPVILSFFYYSCPHLCGFVLNGLSEALRGLDLRPGKDFRVLTVSFDPKDRPEDAREAGKTYRHGFVSPQAWRFFVGDSTQVRKLMEAMGIQYRKVGKEYAHPTAILVLTPEGTISRYLYGIKYPVRDLKLALLEAGEGKIGSLGDKVLLFCYRYDPKSGTYAFYALKLMKLGGLLTLVLLGGFLTALWIREKRRS